MNFLADIPVIYLAISRGYYPHPYFLWSACSPKASKWDFFLIPMAQALITPAISCREVPPQLQVG